MKGLLETSYFKTSPAPLLDMNEEQGALLFLAAQNKKISLTRCGLAVLISFSLFLYLSLFLPSFFTLSLLHASMHALHKLDILK